VGKRVVQIHTMVFSGPKRYKMLEPNTIRRWIQILVGARNFRCLEAESKPEFEFRFHSPSNERYKPATICFLTTELTKQHLIPRNSISETCSRSNSRQLLLSFIVQRIWRQTKHTRHKLISPNFHFETNKMSHALYWGVARSSRVRFFVLLRRVILRSCTARHGNSWAHLNKQRIVGGYSGQHLSVDWHWPYVQCCQMGGFPAQLGLFFSLHSGKCFAVAGCAFLG